MCMTAAYSVSLRHRFPSQVFVGDTFTYFAGMTFAVVGILGHFRLVGADNVVPGEPLTSHHSYSRRPPLLTLDPPACSKTLLLFFAPQIINFL